MTAPLPTDISVKGLNSIRSYEGRALRAYQDVVGVWTIGYGLTNMDKGLGFKVGPGVTITADQAEELLYSSLRRNYLPEVERVLLLDKCEHPQGALDGGLSFHFNTGGIGRASWPKELLAGNMSAARVSFQSWNKAGGKVIGGLVRRRASEWNIIANENYGTLSGPEEEGTRGQRIGTGELLTALPLHAATEVVAGSVKETGIPVAATPAPGALRLGDVGPAVIELQKALTAAGHPVEPTGTFDEGTQAQVIAVQQSHPNLTADGVAGPATTAALARTAALNKQVKTVTQIAPVVPVVATGLWQYLSAHAGQIALVGGAVAVVLVIAYVVYQHRSEVTALFNKATGTVTA